jgi:hypothetical protein
MVSTNDTEHDKLIYAICNGSGKDDERSSCFSKMVQNKKIQEKMKGIKAKLWIPICQRGHEKLFKLFSTQFEMTFEDISGGRGKILIDCLCYVNK